MSGLSPPGLAGRSASGSHAVVILATLLTACIAASAGTAADGAHSPSCTPPLWTRM